MRTFTTLTDSNVEGFRSKQSELLFYKEMDRLLNGVGISKIVPFQNQRLDLLYTDFERIALFHFLDTNEDTYSILADEIIEVMEEQYAVFVESMEECGLDRNVSFYFVMPYVQLEESSPFLDAHVIDQARFLQWITGEKSIPDAMTRYEKEELDRMLFSLCRECYVLKRLDDRRRTNSAFPKMEAQIGDDRFQVLFLSRQQLSMIGDIKFGNSLITGASGTGKTTLLFSKAYRLANLYPKKKFLYLTFGKQLSYELNLQMKQKEMQVPNLKIINFHQYILLLAKKFNIKMNSGRKQNFEQEFYRVFAKVKELYKKAYFKGVFVDEGENFSLEELLFLQSTVSTARGFFMLSKDKGKDIKNVNISLWKGADEVTFEHATHLDVNFRLSQEVNVLVNRLIDTAEDYMYRQAYGDLSQYFFHSYAKTRERGEFELRYSRNSEDMLAEIAHSVKQMLESGRYQYGDILIVYPFNQRKTKSKGLVHSKQKLRMAMEEAGIPYLFAGDQMKNMTDKIGVTLSNVFNITNLEYKAVIFCEIETIFDRYRQEGETDCSDLLFTLNILYTVISRSTDKVTVYKKQNAPVHPVIDLLEESL